MNVLVIGASNVDVIAHSNSRILAQHETKGTVKFRHGGTARNIVELLARLDVPSSLLTVVGKDIIGDSLLAALQKMGVDMKMCIQISESATATNVHIMDLEGDMYTSITGTSLTFRLTPQVLKDTLKDALETVLVDSTLQFNALQYIALETEAEKKIFEPIDYFDWTELTEILPKFDIIKLNKFQAERLRGGMITGLADAKDCAKYLLNEKGLQSVFIILDEYGSIAANQEELVHIPAFQSENFARPGAEQAYTAAIVYGLQNNLTFYQTALFAQACYALALDLPQGEMEFFTLQRVGEILRTSAKIDMKNAEKSETVRRLSSPDDEEILGIT